MKIDFDRMAKDFMFGKMNSHDVIKKHSAAFRKGKTYGSIERALMNAFKKGQQKTELEIDLFAIGLSNVFKAHKHRILTTKGHINELTESRDEMRTQENKDEISRLGL